MPGVILSGSFGQPSLQLITPSPSASPSEIPQPQMPGAILSGSAGRRSMRSGDAVAVGVRVGEAAAALAGRDLERIVRAEVAAVGRAVRVGVGRVEGEADRVAGDRAAGVGDDHVVAAELAGVHRVDREVRAVRAAVRAAVVDRVAVEAPLVAEEVARGRHVEARRRAVADLHRGGLAGEARALHDADRPVGQRGVRAVDPVGRVGDRGQPLVLRAAGQHARVEGHRVLARAVLQHRHRRVRADRDARRSRSGAVARRELEGAGVVEQVEVQLEGGVERVVDRRMLEGIDLVAAGGELQRRVPARARVRDQPVGDPGEVRARVGAGEDRAGRDQARDDDLRHLLVAVAVAAAGGAAEARARPAVVREVDRGARLPVGQRDDAERVVGTAVVLPADDGDITGGQVDLGLGPARAQRVQGEERKNNGCNACE